MHSSKRNSENRFVVFFLFLWIFVLMMRTLPPLPSPPPGIRPRVFILLGSLKTPQTITTFIPSNKEIDRENAARLYMTRELFVQSIVLWNVYCTVQQRKESWRINGIPCHGRRSFLCCGSGHFVGETKDRQRELFVILARDEVRHSSSAPGGCLVSHHKNEMKSNKTQTPAVENWES